MRHFFNENDIKNDKKSPFFSRKMPKYAIFHGFQLRKCDILIILR